MNAMSRSALNAYSQVNVDSSIASASPHKLISMLFDGAIVAVFHGKSYMLQGNIAAKGESISKAIAIIDEGLKISLDEEAGGEMAKNLKALYEYMSYRLLMANARNDLTGLDEVARLLGELKGAWEQIGQPAKPVSPPSAVEKQPASSRPSISYGKA
jgi:flagellar protein FliS